MNPMALAVVIVVVGLFIALVSSAAGAPRGSAQGSARGVCAFDLDNTVTCGLDSARAAIAKCKSRGMRLAINTARLTRDTRDIDLVSLGLGDVGEDFYVGTRYTCSFESAECFNAAVAETKVSHLEHLAQKYGVPRAHVVLFDDLESNVRLARARGFSAIHANSPGCGIPADAADQLDQVLETSPSH